MDLQSYDRRIISLASTRKLVHRCEDRVDHVVGALCVAFGRRPSEALYSPLLAARIYRFNHPVRVAEHPITRIKLNSALLIDPIRKHSDGRTTGFKPNDRAVS